MKELPIRACVFEKLMSNEIPKFKLIAIHRIKKNPWFRMVNSILTERPHRKVSSPKKCFIILITEAPCSTQTLNMEYHVLEYYVYDHNCAFVSYNALPNDREEAIVVNCKLCHVSSGLHSCSIPRPIGSVSILYARRDAWMQPWRVQPRHMMRYS